MVIVFWVVLLTGASGLLLAQATMIRRIRRARALSLLESGADLPQHGVLALLDLRLGGKEVDPAAGPPLRVVLATRDRRFRRVCQFLLVRHGFTVEHSRNLEAAVELAERSEADAVVLDSTDSLLGAARALRRLAEQQPGIAVVVVSEGEEEAPQTLPILPKWGGFDEIVEAIRSAHAGVSQARAS